MTMQIEQVRGMIDSLWGQIPQEYMIVFTFAERFLLFLIVLWAIACGKYGGVFWDFSQEGPAGA